MSNQSGYMQLSRFLDLIRKRSFSQGADSRLEFLLYQVSLAMLRLERSPEEGELFSSALMELEHLNLMMTEAETDPEEKKEVDRKLLNGLTRIVSRIGGEDQCSMLTEHLLRRPSA